MKNHSYIFLIAILFSLFATSCRTQKDDLTYFQNLPNQQGSISTVEHINTIEPENNLVIIVKSDVLEASAEFNLPYANPTTPGTVESISTTQLQMYRVDAHGDIDFPKLGKIHVAGMTTYELKEYLTKRISEYVKDPLVTVDLEGYRIVVMGEVNNPVTINTSADRFSLLDALAAAGDLSQYADRENILILRRNADNQVEYYHVNLLDANVVGSSYFWLKNNDVVMVSPNKIKQDNSKYNQFNSYKLSVISTVVSACSIIASLVIALTVK